MTKYLYQNSHWAVTRWGIYRLDGREGPIEKNTLDDERNGLSDWVLHVAETNNPEYLAPFCDALKHALRIHKVKHSFDVDASLRYARGYYFTGPAHKLKGGGQYQIASELECVNPRKLRADLFAMFG
jgi:hypothetical protein